MLDFSIESFLQIGGMMLFDVCGPFPRLPGWLWNLVASTMGLLTASTITALNITRVFLIKKVIQSLHSNVRTCSLQVSKT